MVIIKLFHCFSICTDLEGYRKGEGFAPPPHSPEKWKKNSLIKESYRKYASTPPSKLNYFFDLSGKKIWIRLCFSLVYDKYKDCSQ